MFNFDEVLSRLNTNCKRWDNIYNLHHDSEIIPMGIADMDFPIHPDIISSLNNRLQHPCFGYTFPCDELRNLVVENIATQHNWTIDPEWIVFYPDTTTALYFIFQGLLKKNKSHVILQPPVFSCFYQDIPRAGLNVLENPLVYNSDFSYSIDFDHFTSLLKNNNNIHSFLLCNPQNPIGRVFNKNELSQIGEICLEHKCPIISDELHSDLVHPNYKHIPIASLNKEIQNQTITLYSPGKAFNIAGLKISVAIIPNSNMRSKIKFITHTMDPNIFGLVAFQTILSQDMSLYKSQLINYLLNNFNYMSSFFNQYLPSFNITPPQSTFLAWVNLKKLYMSHQQLEEFFIKKVKISISHGNLYGTGGEGFIRFNIGMPKSQLQIALERLKYSVESL